jgi:RHS repeat-associated protein
VTSVADPASPSNSHSYGYDVLDRLTTALSGAATPTTRQYGYDAIGNRLNETADGLLTNYGYGPDSHRLQNLTGATTRSYGYDGAGNPVTIDARTHTYNLANRLTKIAQGATTIASYKHNALGQRVAKTIGSTTTRYVYDEQGRLIGEYAANGALIQETVWLNDLPVATLRPTGTGTPTPIAVYYVHADHLGSPRAITRPSDDAIVWRWDNADPFGDHAADENPSGLGNFRYDLRFPGQQYDAEVGTHYNYFRDYDPGTGRYLQSDPIGLEGGTSSYAYPHDPLAFVDSEGLLGRGPGVPRSGPPNRITRPALPPAPAYCDGRWVRTETWRTGLPGVDLIMGRTPTCYCRWICRSCPGGADVTRSPPFGTHVTQGRLFYGGGTGSNTDPEIGDTCLCPLPGPQRGCNACTN